MNKNLDLMNLLNDEEEKDDEILEPIILDDLINADDNLVNEFLNENND